MFSLNKRKMTWSEIILISSYEQWDIGPFLRIELPHQPFAIKEGDKARTFRENMKSFMWIMVLLCHVELHRLKPKTACMLQSRLFRWQSHSLLAQYFVVFSLLFFCCCWCWNTASRVHLHQWLQSFDQHSLEYLFYSKKETKKNTEVVFFWSQNENRGIESFLTWNCKTVNLKLSLSVSVPAIKETNIRGKHFSITNS